MTSPTPTSLPRDSREFYEGLITARGIDNATDFSVRGSAERFAMILDCVKEDQLRRGRRSHEMSLLDVGCGVGHLASYLLDRHVPFNYVGVDLHAPFVARCNERLKAAKVWNHPAALHGDITDREFAGSVAARGPFDYAVASGVFCHRDQETVHHTMLHAMWRLAACGLVVNFLTHLNPARPEQWRTWHPREAIALAEDLGCRKFDLRHAYLPNDFTLALYR